LAKKSEWNRKTVRRTEEEVEIEIGKRKMVTQKRKRQRPKKLSETLLPFSPCLFGDDTGSCNSTQIAEVKLHL